MIIGAFPQKDDSREMSSYLAFAAASNPEGLDAAFGKGNEALVKGLGAQLAMYGWFKGIEKEDGKLLNMDHFDTLSELFQNSEYKRYLTSSAEFFPLIQASPYAFDLLKNTSSGQPDLILYDHGQSEYLDLSASATTGSITYNGSGESLSMSISSGGISLASGSVSIPFSEEVRSSLPFTGYRYLNIEYGSCRLQYGYKGGGFGISLYGNGMATGVSINQQLTTFSGLRTTDNFLPLRQPGETTSMVISLSVSAFQGSTFSSTLVINKIWLTEV